MTKFAKCINNDWCHKELTVGKTYKFIYEENSTIYIVNDFGDYSCYNKNRFEITNDKSVISLEKEKLNSLKNLLIFLANKQTTKDLEEYEVLKNLMNEVEEKFN